MTLFELQAWLGHRTPHTTQHYAKITPNTLTRAYTDAGYFARNVRTIEVLLDRDAVASGAAATGEPWQHYDLGHGWCTYSFFEQCPHRMACARCDFYTPKGSTKAQLLEAKDNLQRMLASIPLTDDERAAVDDGHAALDALLGRLTDVPTPAGPTPRQIGIPPSATQLPIVAVNQRKPEQIGQIRFHRINGWVHNLQVSGQVVNFLTHHLGFPIPSPAILEKIGLRFRKAVAEFAAANDIEVVRFAKGERKLEVMRPHLDRLVREGRCGVAAIGVAQEFQRVFTGTTYHPDADGGGVPRFGYHKADRRVTAYYFYVVDEVFGPAFMKVCAYFPYPCKIWINGHEFAKRAATAAGIGFTELDNGFATTDDPAGLQRVCDTLGPGTIAGFCERWWARLPLPLTDADRAGGYWWDIAMRQVEVSRTIVFDQPRHARGFFEALCTDNLDIGRPEQMQIVFGRRVRIPPPAGTAPGCCARGTRSPSTPTSGIPG